MSMGIIESGEYNKVAGLGDAVTAEYGKAALTNVGITADTINVSYVKIGRLVTLTVLLEGIRSEQSTAGTYATLTIGTVPAKLKPAIAYRADCHFQAREVPYIAGIDTAGHLKVWQWGQPTAIENGVNTTFSLTYVSES